MGAGAGCWGTPRAMEEEPWCQGRCRVPAWSAPPQVFPGGQCPPLGRVRPCPGTDSLSFSLVCGRSHALQHAPCLRRGLFPASGGSPGVGAFRQRSACWLVRLLWPHLMGGLYPRGPQAELAAGERGLILAQWLMFQKCVLFPRAVGVLIDVGSCREPRGHMASCFPGSSLLREAEPGPGQLRSSAVCPSPWQSPLQSPVRVS